MFKYWVNGHTKHAITAVNISYFGDCWARTESKTMGAEQFAVYGCMDVGYMCVLQVSCKKW